MPTSADHVVARRYGHALVELAEEQKQLDQVAEDMRTLRTLEKESPEFRTLAASPRLSRAQMVQTAQQVAASAKLGPLTANFLALVAQNRRLPQIGAMCDAFLAELAKKRGEFEADVRAASPLSPAQQEQLGAQLKSLAGGKVRMTISEDKSLLGGITIRMGSKLIDASVRGRLERLERQLKSQPLNSLEGAA